ACLRLTQWAGDEPPRYPKITGCYPDAMDMPTFPVPHDQLPEAIVNGVEELVGSRPIAGLRALGGFSIAERWSLQLEDGRRVFAKLGTTKDLGHRLQAEYRNMLMVPQEFRCQVVAWRGTHPRLLVVEDLSDARWPPP